MAAHAQPVVDKQKWVALGLALGVHLMLVLFLFFSVNWKTAQPAAVEVELVRAAATPPIEPPTKPTPKAVPVPLPPPPKPTPKAVPVPLPPPPKAEPVAKPDIALKDREKPKPPPKAPPPPPREEEPPKPRPKPALDTRQNEALAREMKALEDKRINQQIERELAKTREEQAAAAAQAEATARAALKDVQATAARNRAIASYADKLRTKIRGNILRPPDLRGNPMVKFDVTQSPAGDILDVTLVTSSGNRVWDETVERAIRKSSPLPKPELADLYQRILQLTFCPDEDRVCR